MNEENAIFIPYEDKLVGLNFNFPTSMPIPYELKKVTFGTLRSEQEIKILKELEEHYP